MKDNISLQSIDTQNIVLTGWNRPIDFWAFKKMCGVYIVSMHSLKVGGTKKFYLYVGASKRIGDRIDRLYWNKCNSENALLTVMMDGFRANKELYSLNIEIIQYPMEILAIEELKAITRIKPICNVHKSKCSKWNVIN